MKVSKVNHVRTAVGKSNGTGQKTQEISKVNGVLYAYPNKEKKEKIELVTHVKQVNSQSQRLYQVFVPIKKIDRRDKWLVMAITNNFRSLIKVALLDVWNKNKFRVEENKQNEIINKQLKKLREIQNEKIIMDRKTKNFYTIAQQKYQFEDRNQKQFIHQLVSMYLRASLRKDIKIGMDETNKPITIYAPDVIEKIVYAMCQSNNYAKAIAEIPEKELRALLTLINADYGKVNQIEKIVDSIEKQKVKVQYQGETGKLQLASAEHTKKKYIFKFLKEYTASNEDDRKKMLIHIRQLILLYYCGVDKYTNSIDGDLTPWGFGSLREDVSTNFNDKVLELINEKAQLSSKDKLDKRTITEQIKMELRNTIAQNYRVAMKVKELSDEDKFWLQYFEKSAEKILLSKSNIGPEKLSTAYLCDYTWKEWVAFIANKYVDMGKAVYHFTNLDICKKEGLDTVNIGEVLPEYREGITSFDYERITANESVERELSRYITFAVNNFSRAVLSDEERCKEEDILLLGNTDCLYDDTTRRILQYFGGKSVWANSKYIDDKGNETTIDICDGVQLFLAIRQELATLRNSHFHYTATINAENCTQNPLVKAMFHKELIELGAKYRKKFYSNNVPMFYSVDNINTLMDRLYNGTKVRQAQVPSFNKVISRSNFHTIISSYINGKNLGHLSGTNKDSSVGEKFRSSLYFVLKEIYYYDFLQLADMKQLFLNALEEQEKKEKDKNRIKAIANFKERVDAIDGENVSFGEICQQLITDYEQQNDEKLKKIAGKEVDRKQRDGSMKKVLVKSENTEPIYQHFKMLLYVCIKEAFLTYLKTNEEFCFLREPKLREQEFQNLSEEVFCAGWDAHTYDDLEDVLEREPVLRSWYVTAHFLNPKQLNHLVGSVKTYIQYVESIEKRAAAIDNRVDVNAKVKIAQYLNIQRVLEFSMAFCGQLSGVLGDYYGDEDAEVLYAAHLAKFLDWNKREKQSAISLKEFCQKEIKIGKNSNRIGIYYDGENPILNRNVVMSMLYGSEKLLVSCMDSVDETDIKMYYKGMENLQDVFRSGKCKDARQQILLKEFQNQKNRIELLDATIYSELVNDLLSQLVNWSYLRERDLMYMQLGFYYIKLFHTQSVSEDSFLRKLTGNEISISDGAVLYQIAAMYSYDLPVYGLDEKGKAVLPEKNYATGRNVIRFVNEYCGKDEEIYNAGLCFFENINEHEEIIHLRNYIDHFKYYSRMDVSILELYSQVYDRFFSYDIRLKKSVPYVFQNILMRYFVMPDVSFDKCGEKSYTVKRNGKKENFVRKAAQITIGSKGLTSDVFTYKLPDVEKEVLVKARTDQFLAQLKNILEYKEIR